MTLEHFDLSLQTMQRRQPFQPFIVEMLNGGRIVVDRPDAITLRAGVAIFMDASGAPILFDHESVSQLVGEPTP